MLTREEVLHIARLARLGLSEEDVDKFREQLSNIMENFKVLQQVDTTNVPPTTQSISLHDVMRADEAAASCPVEDIMANAPRREGDFFRVKPVLE
jgi:aspartyl-tRNA(Asn)/glutamyl-tRNA(Gln) amidotransferase subunit C